MKAKHAAAFTYYFLKIIKLVVISFLKTVIFYLLSVAFYIYLKYNLFCLN